MSIFLIRAAYIASEVDKAANAQLSQGALSCTYCPILGAVVSIGIAAYSLIALISQVFKRCLKSSDLNGLEGLNQKIRDYQVLLAYNCVNIVTLGGIGAVLPIFNFIATQDVLIKEQRSCINAQNILAEENQAFVAGGVVALAKVRALRDFQDVKVNAICPRSDVAEDDEELYRRTYLDEMRLLNHN